MHERFYGVGEPLIQRQRDQGINAPAYLDLVKGLGCNAYRAWMHLTELLVDPTTPNETEVAMHRKLLDRAKELDIEVTAMSHEWFLPEGCKQKTGHAMPARDLTPGSQYMQTLEMLEQSWYTMVSLFPQVDIWEVGNEWNLNAFLHPDGFLDSDMSHPFTADEKADIAVDMMYFSARGVRRANPNAKVASFSPALSTPGLGGDMPDFLPVMYGVAWTLDKIYSRIKSGKFWSSNPDDYFDLVAWHPYVFTNRDVPGCRRAGPALEELQRRRIQGDEALRRRTQAGAAHGVRLHRLRQPGVGAAVCGIQPEDAGDRSGAPLCPHPAQLPAPERERHAPPGRHRAEPDRRPYRGLFRALHRSGGRLPAQSQGQGHPGGYRQHGGSGGHRPSPYKPLRHRQFQ